MSNGDMEEKIPLSVFLWVLGGGVGFLGTWVWSLYNSHQRLMVKVAEDCVKKSDMQAILKEFKEDNRQLFNEIKDEMRRERQEIMSAIGKKQDRT